MLRPENHGSEPKNRWGEGKENSLMNKNTTLKTIFQISSLVSLTSIRGHISS